MHYKLRHKAIVRSPKRFILPLLAVVVGLSFGGGLAYYAPLQSKAAPVKASPRSAGKVSTASTTIPITAPLANQQPTPSAPKPPVAAVASPAPWVPARVLDLTNWYLGLPTGKDDDPDSILQPQLARYETKPWFYVNDAKDGVVFAANVGGATTDGSMYPRSELREMKGSAKASWDGNVGTHVMEITQAITKTPPVKPDVIAGQIHGTDDDVMQIHLSGTKLCVKYDDGNKSVDIDPNYVLGTKFTVKIQSSGGHVKVWYNGQQKADLAINSATSYFKAGAYVNSNPTKGDKPDAVGEVIIYSLQVSHT